MSLWAIGGLAEYVEIDKSLLRGKHKYHKGRILLRDRRWEIIFEI